MLITNYAIKFRTAVAAFIVALIIGGAISYVRLPREGAPDITIPYVFVNAVYEGVAPEEMENLVAIPLEKQFKDLENLKEMRSTSAEGVTTVVMEFTPRQDMDDALQRVKDKMDLARPDLPDDLDEPVAQAFNFSADEPIVLLTLSGDLDLERLRLLAEDLQDRVEEIPGVKSATLLGVREREIRVELDPARLQAYGLTPGEIHARLAKENRTISAGNLEIGDHKFQVRVPGEFQLPLELTGLVVAFRDGRPIYLSDVGRVEDTFKDRETISRLNGEPCVTLQIKKRSGENTVRLSRALRRLTDEFPRPPGAALTVTMDQADFIRDMVAELENNIFAGFVLVVAVILVFLGRRNSLLVGSAIPLSLLLSFLMITAAGLTLNMIVLFSLVIAIGMLVDNAIVIVENTYRLHRSGLTRLEASRRGAAEVAWPVITSSLTTIAAFLPLLYWPNIMGQFMGFLPRTLILVLIASLFVALVINPAICSHFIQRGRDAERAEGGRFERFAAAYERLLRRALRLRGPILLLGLLGLILSVLVYVRLDRGLELFPATEPRRATISVKFPEGTRLERTDAELRRIEAKLAGEPDIKFYVTTVGAIGGAGMGGGAGAQLGAIEVEFKPPAERASDTLRLIERIRDDIGVIAGADVKVDREEMGPPTGAPISLELSGEDFDVLGDLSAAVMARMRTVPNVVDIQDDFESARPEIRFHVDRARAARVGLTTDQVGDYLRTAVFGSAATKFRAGEDQHDITLRFPAADRSALALLERAFVPLPAGGSAPLTSLGRAEYAAGRGDIRRKDRKRMITITADLSGARSVDRVLADIRAEVERLDLPAGYRVAYAGDTKEMNESGAFLGRAFLAAVGLIAIILVIQFNSLVYPFIILFSVVLSLMGVLWGLVLCGMRFGVVMTGLGVISLAGVVVNNSIVLVDCMLQLRRGGLSSEEAIIAAGRRRLRPVLLTAITTILGLIPMAIGWSVEIHSWPPKFVAGAESSAWWAPMAVAVIFGLAFATVLTLIQVPLMCSFADRWVARTESRHASDRESAAETKTDGDGI